eukprot:m.12922 g.12922  ORF g.12922 m.12922 type:complete len:221 (+) comp5880_c0_seq1:291-953(+)
MPNLGDTVENFALQTTQGSMNFHDYIGDQWCLLFSHPADYTPVCTTEMAQLAKLVPEFTKRNCKVIALSCDPVEQHLAWSKDVCAFGGLEGDLPYPIIADESREIAHKLGMLDDLEKDAEGVPLTARAVFIIDPSKKVKLSILYPATTGRNFTEIIRALDSVQLTLHKMVATPVDWKAGEDCIVVPSVKPEEEASLFPKGVTTKELPSGKRYLRYTPQPE